MNVMKTMDSCLSAQTEVSNRPQYALVISAFVLLVVVLVGSIVMYKNEQRKVQKNHEANERKSLVEHPN